MELALKDEFQFKVLVVDDDPTILSLLKDVLSMVPGCQIITASNPKEAMPEIVKGGVDIIFTDIHMPGYNGLEFIQDVVSLEHTPEVIVMTAYATGENAQSAMELGASSFLEKPFKDISIVESELQKAIKRVIRQRLVEKEVSLKKLELSKVQPLEPDQDPLLRVSLPSFPSGSEGGVNETGSSAVLSRPEDIFSISGISAISAISALVSKEENPESVGSQTDVRPSRRTYEVALLEPLIEIEVERCKRYNRQFAVSFVDLPEDPQARMSDEDRVVSRLEKMKKLESLVRRSDVLMDAGRDGVAILAYECNKVGSEVLESKLLNNGFQHSGFSIYPNDGADPTSLIKVAKTRVQIKRKIQILVHEPEQFFGRLIQNMLSDPKYHVTWTQSLDDLYKTALDISESVKLLVLSLSKDKDQWKLIAKMLREGLVKWPIMLFVDVPLSKDVKAKLSKLGVKAVVNKGASHDDIMYLAQSFVMPKPQGLERKNFRALVTIPVTYKYQEQNMASNTFTLSRDGMFIRDMNPPPSGEILELEVFTPKKILKTRAEVLYAIPYFVGVNRIHVPGFAVRFIDLTEEERDQVETVVEGALTSYLI